jgi:uncharacterized membrane protein SpoIIM required for sporulation
MKSVAEPGIICSDTVEHYFLTKRELFGTVQPEKGAWIFWAVLIDNKYAAFLWWFGSQKTCVRNIAVCQIRVT